MTIRDGSLGKVEYYDIREEFQFLGSPHIHRFLWVLNAPTFAEKILNEYFEFLDSVVCGNLPLEEEDQHLYQLVKTFQIHCHSKLSVNIKIVNVVSSLGVFLLTKLSLQYRCNTH